MPTGGVTVGATPPAQHVPQEAGQPPAQTTTTTTTTRRSGENRRVSVFERNLTEEYMFNLLPLKRMGSKVRSKSRRVSSIFFEILSDRDRLDVKIRIYIYIYIVDVVARIDFKEFKKFREIELSTKYIILDWPRRCSIVRPCSTPKKWQQSIPTILQRCPNTASRH